MAGESERVKNDVQIVTVFDITEDKYVSFILRYDRL